jgi:predicted membrane protein
MEQDFNNSYQKGYTKGLGFGLVLILIGIVFLLFNFNLLPAQLKWVILSWPSLLIVFGIINLFKKQFVSSVILFLVGIFFLVPKIVRAFPEAYPNGIEDFTQNFWPILLIAAGVVLIVGKLFPSSMGNCAHSCSTRERYSKTYVRNGGIEKNSVFGSGEHIVLEPEFEGGELNAVFGSITIDLRKTSLKEGVTRLETNAVFGSVTIFVPSEWMVETNVDAVFGGFEDQRKQVETIDMSRKLLITGACVFGGTELRN